MLTTRLHVRPEEELSWSLAVPGLTCRSICLFSAGIGFSFSSWGYGIPFVKIEA